MGQFKLKTTTSSTNTLQRFIPNEHPRSHSGLCSCCSHAGLRYQKFLPPPSSFPGSVHELCYLSTNFQCDLCRRRLTGAIALTSARRAPAVRPRRYHVRSLLNYNYETTNPLIVPPYGLCLDTCHRHMNRVISQEARLCPSGVLSSMATELTSRKEKKWFQHERRSKIIGFARQANLFSWMRRNIFLLCDAIIIIIFLWDHQSVGFSHQTALR